MFVVTGASGQTGRATVQALLEQKQPVTAVVRSQAKTEEWKARGAETALLDVADTAALTALLKGRAGAYLMVPPNYGAADYLKDRQAIINSFAQAVRDSGIPHVVFLSSVGAQHPAGTGPIVTLHNGEKALRQATRNLTSVRAPYFLENWAPVLNVARDQGTLPSFLTPGRKIPSIATRDIGRFAADSLVRPASGVRILEIAGPDDYAPEDIAVAVSQALGKDVKLRSLPLDAVVPTFTAQGISEGMARLMAEMYGAINSGHIAFEHMQQVQRGSVTPAEVFRQLAGKAFAA